MHFIIDYSNIFKSVRMLEIVLLVFSVTNKLDKLKEF